MSNDKNLRQARILKLIENFDIATQDEITEHLAREGFEVAQATVSRDLRTLGLIKREGEDGRSYYRRPDGLAELQQDSWSRVYREAVLDVDVAGTLVVIRTLPGMAPGAAAFIDRAPEEGLVGSIAGDDTIFLATTSEERAEHLAKLLLKLSGLEE